MSIPDPAFLVSVLLLLGLIPFAAVLATSYAKLVIVLGLLRLALGTQQVPPNIVLNAVAVVLTIFIMAPVGTQAYERIAPIFERGQQPRLDDLMRALQAGAEPVRLFLDKHTRPRERRIFMQAAGKLWPSEEAKRVSAEDLTILLPSFMLSELTQAFQIGFILFVVFTVVDLLVAAILLALGMSMVSPLTLAIPFKLLLFVALDGWALLVQGMMLTYK